MPLNLLEGLQILVANLNFYDGDKRKPLRLFDRLEDKSLIGMSKGEFRWLSYEFRHASTKLDTVEAWRVYEADLAITAVIVLKLDPPCVSFDPLYIKFFWNRFLNCRNPFELGAGQFDRRRILSVFGVLRKFIVLC